MFNRLSRNQVASGLAVALVAFAGLTFTSGQFVPSPNAGGAGGVSVGGTVTGGTTGSVLFVGPAGVLAQDNATFFWDDTNGKLGIGTNNPGGGYGFASMVNVFARQAGATFFDADSITASADVGYMFSSATLNKDCAIFQDDSDGQKIKIACGTFTNHASLQAGTKVTVQQTGEVGIGNTSPGSALDVTGTIRTSALSSGSVCIAGASGAITQDSSFVWDASNHRLGIGATSPAQALDVRVSAGGGAGIETIENKATDGYSDVLFNKSDDTLEGAIGYGNSTVGITGFRGLMFLFSNGPDWIIGNGTANEFQFGMTDGSTFVAMRNGASAAASAASTGRIVYTTTGQKFQASANGGSYFNMLVSNYIVGTGTPSINNGSLGTGSDDFSGSVTGVGATTATLTYAVAATNRSRCGAWFNGHSVATEIVEVTNSASAPVFNCFNATTGVAANCDDFTYICVKQ